MIMQPVICKIWLFQVYSYGLMLVIAFLTAIFLIRRQGRRDGFDPDTLFNLCFICLASGIIGARVFYVVEHIDYYAPRLWEIFFLHQGGLSWFGSLILGGLSGIIYAKKKKLPLFKTLDLLAPYLALGQAIGRIGCFLNGCCYGFPSRYGLYFPVLKARLVPVQLYSALLLFLIFLILRFIKKRQHRPGVVLFSYLWLYSLVRFFIEFLRADNPPILFGLTLFQLLSIPVFIFASLQLIAQSRQR